MADTDRGLVADGIVWWQDRSLWTKIWQGLAIAAAVIQCVSVILIGSTIVSIAGVLCIGLACAVFYFQTILQQNDSLRAVQNQLRHEVNRLHRENIQLESSINRLGVQVEGLKETETKLAAITEQQGSNVQEFCGMVKENQQTLNGLKKVVKSEAEQTFLRAVLDSDFDQSNEFSDQEVQMLEYRLRNVPGMTINQEMLKTKVKASDRSLASVLQLLSELYNDDIKDEERIFQIHEEELLKK